MDRLPPFDALIAFDTAARLRSMTLAAKGLGLTPSAVSHRIRRLEAFMGVPLLYRHNAGLTPTPAGEALMEGLAGVMDSMAELRKLCLAAAGPHRMRVGVGAALAQNWLLRRLPNFAAAHPEISIEVVVVENEAPQQVADLDVRVLWVPVTDLRSMAVQQPLFQERVFPVCHPSLLPNGFVPGDIDVLRDLPLVHKGPAGRDTAKEWSWSTWLERLGLPQRTTESLRFTSIGPAITAALEGAGAVLARTMLVHDAIAEGRLVRLLSSELDMPSSKAHIVRWPVARRTDERVRIFVQWLCRTADETCRIEGVGALGSTFVRNTF